MEKERREGNRLKSSRSRARANAIVVLARWLELCFRRVNLQLNASVAIGNSISSLAHSCILHTPTNPEQSVKMSTEQEESQNDELAGGPGAPTPLSQLEVKSGTRPARNRLV